MSLIAPQDSAFLLGETAAQPTHVAGLAVYELPPGAGPDYVSQLYHELLTHTEIHPRLRQRPADPVGSVGNVWWTEEHDIDLEYHVRLAALPRPGRVRELLELVSRLHSQMLDRHHPLWEFYLIEGLEGGRFATYTKIHHALYDGVASTQLRPSEAPPSRSVKSCVMSSRPARSAAGVEEMARSMRFTVTWLRSGSWIQSFAPSPTRSCLCGFS